MKILFRGATVISMDETRDKQCEVLDVLVDGEDIAFVGEHYLLDYDQVIEAKGCILMPGLINAHTHLGMSIFRASNDSYSLMDWLTKKIWPIEEQLSEEDLYYSTLLSCLEMIKTGTTCANDMYIGWRGILRAMEDSQARFVASRFLIGDKDAAGMEKIHDFEEMVQAKSGNPLITFAVTPHSLYTCSESYLKEAGLLASRYQLPLHLHFCENLWEVHEIYKKYHKSPTQVLEDLGYFKYKLILAHGTFLSLEDQKRLKGHDVSIVTNPISNLNLGCGIADLVSYKKQNINVALGSDGQGSGNHMNLFSHMAFACDLQKVKYQDPTVFSSYDTLKMATISAASALGLADKIGSIVVGKKADLILLDLSNLEVTPMIDLFSLLVHNVESRNIVLTMVNGKILMQDRILKIPIDEERIKQKVRDIVKKFSI